MTRTSYINYHNLIIGLWVSCYLRQKYLHLITWWLGQSVRFGELPSDSCLRNQLSIILSIVPPYKNKNHEIYLKICTSLHSYFDILLFFYTRKKSKMSLIIFSLLQVGNLIQVIHHHAELMIPKSVFTRWIHVYSYRICITSLQIFFVHNALE